MINLFRQPILRTSLQTSFVTSTKRIRQASTLTTTYSSFPASLLRYNTRQKSSLYNRSERDNRPDDPNWDGIEISAEDGLIHPGASKDPTLYKGALLMPNTFTMQEFIRTEIDCYFDNEESGKDVEIPLVYSIRKGTVVPRNLLLFREGLSRFSLQPSWPMSIEDFNKSLDKFYELYAEKNTAEQWLDDNDFQSAVGDDAEEVWMAK